MSPERAIEIDCERDEQTNLPLDRAMTNGTVSSLLSRSITDRLDTIAMKSSPAVAVHALPMIFLTNRAFADDGPASEPALLRLEFFALLARREAFF
jgi:hypothetical protein